MIKRKLGWRTEPKNQCVGCGFCCLRAPCVHSSLKFGRQDRCPALKWDDEKSRYFCTEYQELDWLMNTGCSSPLFNDWRDFPLQFKG